jgi:hypothetical protein
MLSQFTAVLSRGCALVYPTCSKAVRSAQHRGVGDPLTPMGHTKNAGTPIRIGAGTGIFTRALLAHDEWSSNIGLVNAVEPSPGMRDTFTKLVQDPRVSLSAGTFEQVSTDNGWADAVIIAQVRAYVLLAWSRTHMHSSIQAFHWCPDHDKASVEFARILKPGGVLVFIWNLEDR